MRRLLSAIDDDTRDLFRRVAANVAYVSVGTAVDTGLLFVVLTIAGRFLGPVVYGEFFTAYVLVSLGFRLAGIGLDTVLTREVARDRGVAGAYLVRAMAVRVVTSTLSVLFVSAALWFAGYGSDVVEAALFLSAYFALRCFSELLLDVLRANERMRQVALVAVAERGVLLVVAGVFLQNGRPLQGIEVGFVAGGVVRLGTAAVLARSVIELRKLSFDSFRGTREFVRKSLPFGLAGVLTMVYFRGDVLLLSLMAPDGVRTVGLYNAAFMIFNAAVFPAFSLYYGLLPSISRLHSTSPRQLRTLCGFLIVGLIVAGSILGVSTFLLAARLIDWIYGDAFASSARLLRILAPAIVPTYLLFLVNAFLPAVNRARNFVSTVAVTAATNVTLNLALIPRYGAAGAAISTVVSQTLAVGLGLWFVARYFGDVRSELGGTAVAGKSAP